MVYAAPAYTFKDKTQITGYTGRTTGVSVCVASFAAQTRFFDERLIFSKIDNIYIIDNTDLSIEETVLRIMETSGSTN